MPVVTGGRIAVLAQPGERLLEEFAPFRADGIALLVGSITEKENTGIDLLLQITDQLFGLHLAYSKNIVGRLGPESGCTKQRRRDQNYTDRIHRLSANDTTSVQ